MARGMGCNRGSYRSAWSTAMASLRAGAGGPVVRTAFRMHHDGEADVRATYCVLTPCFLIGILDDDNDDGDNGGENPLLSPSVSRHVVSYQTYEGGFGAEPQAEAHGGYAFCGVLSLRLIGRLGLIDARALSSCLSGR
jgi:protein farnesyltransferase subunit beta